MNRILRTRCWLTLICLAIPSLLLAESNYEFRIGTSHSDNVLRDEFIPLEETIVVGGVALDLSKKSKRFDGFLRGDLSYYHYTSGRFDDENYSNFHARADFSIVPNVFLWVVEDRFGKLISDPFGTDTLDNRENVNTFSTGPNLSANLSQTMSVKLSARYTRNRFEISDAGNIRSSGLFAIVRALSRNRSLSLNVTTERVEFDDVSLSDYDRNAAFASFDSQISRGKLKVLLGANEVDYGIETFSGPLIELLWNRSLSSKTSVALAFDRRISDASDEFGRTGSVGRSADETQPITPLADTFEIETLTAGIARSRENDTLNLSVFYSKDLYSRDSGLDSERRGINFGGSKFFSSGWDIGFGGLIETREFKSAARIDDLIELSATLGRRLTRTLRLTFEYRRSERETDVLRGDYVENFLSLNFHYSPRALSGIGGLDR